jgi:manganese-dependent inorganic pyrophosphatase
MNEFLEDIREKMIGKRHKLYPVVDGNGRFTGVLSRYQLISYEKKKVVLVDHNSKSQTIEGIEDTEIVEIIDHHRIAEVQTPNPVYFRNEPVGSTATIIANIYFENDMEPAKDISGILCAALLSDTFKFKSPTCTKKDVKTAEKLAEIAGIDIDEFAYMMFKAGSKFEGKTPKEIFYQDFKDFVFGKYRVGIGQVNVIDDEDINKIKNDILEFMRKTCDEKGYYLIVFLITDIMKEGSECLFLGEGRGVVSRIFNIHTEDKDESVFLPGIVSRKKQVVPAISAIME